MKTHIEHYGERYTNHELEKLRDSMMKICKRGGHIGSYDEILPTLRTVAENVCIVKLYKLGGFAPGGQDGR